MTVLNPSRPGITDVVLRGADPSADAGPMIQAAINSLRPTGGAVGLEGSFTVKTPITTYPGIALVGQGPLAAFTARSATIKSQVNGSTIIATVDPTFGLQSFPYFANFTIEGLIADGAQNGIEFNDSGGSLLDAYMDNVLIFQCGQHGLLVNSGLKLWVNGLYSEDNGGAGIRQQLGSMRLVNSYIFGNTGFGVDTTSAAGAILSANRIESNAAGGLQVWSNGNGVIVDGNQFANNGGGAVPAITIKDTHATNAAFICSGNYFFDSRGAGACNNFIQHTGANTVDGSIIGNKFVGQVAGNPAIKVFALVGNALSIKGNTGFNDVLGVLATPFQTAQLRLGIEGTAAAPAASSNYVVGSTDLYCVFAGGTGVSITITAPNGTVLQSGLASFAGVLPVGYQINFGAFTVAPTTALVSVA